MVLFSLYVLSSCHDPISQPQIPSIPEGKGSFTLFISDINGRTIYPNTTLNSFAEFALEFFPKEGGDSILEMRTNSTLSSSPIILNIGEYDLHVTAYLSTGKVKPAAYGEVPNLEIKDGQNNTGSVSLKAFADSGKGTFRWTITFSGLTLKEASMTITPLGENGDDEQTLYFTGGTPVIQNSSSLELNSGYYNVLFTLIRDDGTQRIERRDILHIYQNLESSFSFTFYSSDFYKKNYIVTYVYNDGVNSDGIETKDIGDKISQTAPTKNGYVFGGWYTTEDLAEAGLWDIDADTVTGDITLYAKWLTAGTFTFQFLITDNTPIVDSGIIINPGIGGTDNATINVKNADDYTDIEWYYNGVHIETGDTLDLDSSIFTGVNGYKFITVEAKKANGALYSALVMIEVRVPAAKIGSTPYATLDLAIKAAVGGTSSAPEEITLLSDVTVPEKGMTANTGYAINAGQHILLTVDADCSLKINASAGSFALFTVNSTTPTSVSSASLTLDGSNGSLTLNGGYLAASTNRRGIYINNGGTVVIKDNVTIAGFRCSNNYGGGVCMNGSNARFTMSGGTIYGSGSDVLPQELRNEAYSYASIYVYSTGTAKFDGRYGTDNISSTNSTLPTVRTLSGTITISPSSSVTTYTKLYAVYNGNEAVSYQWSNSSGSISGATTPQYIPTVYGTYYVTVSAPGYTSKQSSSVSASYSTFAGAISIDPVGEIQPGTLLTANYNGSEPDTNKMMVNYQWRESNSEISGAITSIYTPNDPGIYTVYVSGTGYNSKSSTNAGDFVPYIKPASDKIISLSNNVWKDSTFTGSSQQDWYSIDNVSPGTTYYVWINNAYCTYGDGTKTANTYLSIIYDDGRLVCLDRSYSSSWSGVSFTPASGFSGKVYIQVKLYNSDFNSSTYGIVYSTVNTMPINNTLDLPSKQAEPLSPSTWKQATLSSTSPQHWYSFSVTEGRTYYLWWNESPYYLSGTSGTIDENPLTDVDVTAWYSDRTRAFENTDTAWATPKSFTAAKSGTVTIQVRPKSASSSYGAYEIAYREDNNVRPNGHIGVWLAPASYSTLTGGVWGNGNLTSSDQQDWYRFAVSPGTYYIWLNTYNYGSGKTGNVYIDACYGDGRSIFTYVYNAYSSPRSISVDSTDTTGAIYIRVKYDSRTGTYGVVFNTTNSRPAL